jgi:hypothetical protein
MVSFQYTSHLLEKFRPVIARENTKRAQPLLISEKKRFAMKDPGKM